MHLHIDDAQSGATDIGHRFATDADPGAGVPARRLGPVDRAASWPRWALRLILVGVDGSDGSRRALEWAAGLSKATGAQVLAVHVLTYSREFIHDVMPETMRSWRRELEDDLRTRWVGPLLAAGVEHRAVVVEGESPAAALLDLAEGEHADVLIVGAKARGGFADWVPGGVTYRVAHRARLPVVVVPADWSARETHL